MPLHLDFGNVVAGLIFSGVGFVAFTYGKRTEQPKMMALGGALMVYCYFTSSTAMTCLIGAALTGAVFMGARR